MTKPTILLMSMDHYANRVIENNGSPITPFNLYYEVNRRFIYHNSADGRITVYKR